MNKVRRKAIEEGELKPRRPLIRMKPLQLALLFFTESGNSTFLMFFTNEIQFCILLLLAA